MKWCIFDNENRIFVLNLSSPLTRFLMKAAGIYALWYIVYDYVLLPDGRLDTFLSFSGVNLAGGLLNLMGWDIYSEARVLAVTGSNGVEIQNGCNGLELIGLYMGFIIVYPGGPLQKRIMFLAGGIGLLFIANVFRIMVFALSIYYIPVWWEQVHTYSSYFIFYPIVLTLWYLWTLVTDQDLSLGPVLSGRN
ncbi:MAG: archaeosortase/exosortase family protein [Candidatus Marinimicrobia bacterium]|nr:archaeosortase/exosortase family protein [Candidatus Neomarinimicrobiota bacterium]MDP6611322.1 archaeosortase/exosortase family protein [Candidatus Neomarinimicrobiota bacterium]